MPFRRPSIHAELEDKDERAACRTGLSAGAQQRLECPSQLRRLIQHHLCNHWHHYSFLLWAQYRWTGRHVRWLDRCQLLHTLRRLRHGGDNVCSPYFWWTLLLGGNARARRKIGGFIFMDHRVRKGKTIEFLALIIDADGSTSLASVGSELQLLWSLSLTIHFSCRDDGHHVWVCKSDCYTGYG